MIAELKFYEIDEMDLGSDTEDEEEHSNAVAEQYQLDVREHNLKEGTNMTTKE